MAVAIPLIMAAAGASTAAIVGPSLVLSAVGANAKINKAASRVFGEGVVKFANVAGGVFLAASAAGAFSDPASAAGAFSDPAAAAGAAGAELGPTAGGYVNGADLASDLAASGRGALAAVAPSTAGASAQVAGAMPPPTPVGPAQQFASNIGKGVDKAVGLVKSAMPTGDYARGALITTGGQALAGWAQGKQQEQAEQAQAERDARYRSGSGLRYWAPPAGPSYNPGPGG